MCACGEASANKLSSGAVIRGPHEREPCFFVLFFHMSAAEADTPALSCPIGMLFFSHLLLLSIRISPCLFWLSNHEGRGGETSNLEFLSLIPDYSSFGVIDPHLRLLSMRGPRPWS